MNIWIGDQLYTDYGHWGNSDCTCFERMCNQDTYASMCETLRREYRRQWSREPMASILSSSSNIMFPDDHDIVDSWDQKLRLPPDWQFTDWEELASTYVHQRSKAIIAALQVVCEYQLSLSGLDRPKSHTITINRTTPGNPHTTNSDVVHSQVRLGFVETRTSHASGNPITIPQCDVLFTGITPFLFPDILVNRITHRILSTVGIKDLYDQWNIHREERNSLISFIETNPISLIVGGDAHIGVSSKIEYTP